MNSGFLRSKIQRSSCLRKRGTLSIGENSMNFRMTESAKNLMEMVQK